MDNPAQNPCQRSSALTQDWRQDEFRTSSFTGNDPQSCVEVATRPGVVAVRNSNHAWGDGPVVEYTHDEWQAFLQGAKAGEFDLS